MSATVELVKCTPLLGVHCNVGRLTLVGRLPMLSRPSSETQRPMVSPSAADTGFVAAFNTRVVSLQSKIVTVSFCKPPAANIPVREGMPPFL